MFLLYENAKFICATLLRFRTFSHVHLKPSSARYCIADKTYKLHITVQDAAAKPEFDKYVVTVNGKEAALKKVGTAYTHLHELESESGYMAYIANRPRAEKRGGHGLFSTADVTDLKAAKNELETHAGKVWTFIFSLRREDAERLG